MIQHTNRKNKIRILALIICISLCINSSKICVYAETVNTEGVMEDPIIMVSLGDSYSSGEGIEPFYGQDEDISEKIKNPDWLAHRSTKSWPGLLSIPGLEGTMSHYKDQNWFFAAASGAVTDNLLTPFEKKYKKGGFEGTYSLDPQLNIFDELEENTVDYVTFTFGGNDVGFSNIITTAVKDTMFSIPYLNPSKLSDSLNNTWENFYKEGGTKEDIKNAYINISQRAGKNAEIIVAGYPKLLDQEGKGLLFTKQQAGEINFNVSRFNGALREIVRSCSDGGMNINFVSVEEAFDGHEAYSDDAYIRGVEIITSLYDNTQDLDVSLIGASAYSVHPNEAGAQAYAKCVQAKIDEIEAAKETEDNTSEDVNLDENPLASEDELQEKAKHFGGIVLKPEDVVLKMFDALQDGDYELAAECLDPATEQQFDFWGGIASTLVGLFTGEYIPWGQLVLEAAGATDVDVIECYSGNLEMESNLDIFSEWLPKIPGLNNLVCTEADVYVKYRYKYNGEYRIQDETCHVRRYEWSGWRIEQEY